MIKNPSNITSYFPKLKKAVINDINEDLINTYKTIAIKPLELISNLEILQNEFHDLEGNEDNKKVYYYEKREQITASILHPELDIPRTTNLIEGWNSTMMELRISSIRGFKKEKYARNYINAIILKYRFHKFKDCKKKFKILNGKSPLEIAKPLNTLDRDFEHGNWITFCKNLKRKFKK